MGCGDQFLGGGAGAVAPPNRVAETRIVGVLVNTPVAVEIVPLPSLSDPVQTAGLALLAIIPSLGVPESGGFMGVIR